MADDEDVWVDSIEAYSKKIEIQKAPEPSQRKSFREKNMIFPKLTCVFPMVIVSIMPHAEFGRNDHRGDEPHFNSCANLNS